jgi:hypothetical protein
MSQVNIKRLVQNIRQINEYTPLIEAIVNSIQAIEDAKQQDGVIEIIIERDNQQKLADTTIQNIQNIKIIDNGIGFNQLHRDSFDEVYSETKIDRGCKGFGRFTFLKYFKEVTIESTYRDGNENYFARTFSFDDKDKQIIKNEYTNDIDRDTLNGSMKTGSTIYLHTLKKDTLYDKRPETIARKLLQKLLLFFFRPNCPTITLKDGSKVITLNSFLNETKDIQEVNNENTFNIAGEDFTCRIFKVFCPEKEKSKIILAAHSREVTENTVSSYINEFEDEFYEDNATNASGKNFILKAYIEGEYLNSNVVVERSTFSFPRQSNNILSQISLEDIEQKASEIIKESFITDFTQRREKKRAKVEALVNEKLPWFKEFIKNINYLNISANPSREEINAELFKAKSKQEFSIQQRIKNIENNNNLDEQIKELSEDISEVAKSDLSHYVITRKHTLDLLKKLLEKQDNEEYSQEKTVHNLIFPAPSNSEEVSYENHNLWLLDERLNFTDFIFSDQKFKEKESERPDLMIFDYPMAFRSENEPSNPVTIFEFKRPGKISFINPSTPRKEDPVEQIKKYVIDLKEGKLKTPQGKYIKINDTTTFYGYVVVELNEDVRRWLSLQHQFTATPDGEGAFNWFPNLHLYMEVISWDKLTKDAQMRNSIFFHKLGI